ncbi:chemotaxis protein CheC [Atopococcus tabaci]|uniref:chemotaxis protein CheC n=1 Tax=Atopococcus tabaci TaxID=269774 RepID=UPI00041ED3ED|nr:chemotaxis protein CheC [Atopococcus tabaci]
MTSYKDELMQSALQEVINIGGGNAATSLSALIGRRVNMEVPTLEWMEYEDVFRSIRAEDEVVKVVLMQLHGGEGLFLFVASPEDAQHLAAMMFPEDMEPTQELVDSAVSELVNILVNSFLNATMKLLDIHLSASVPVMTYDLFGSVLSSVYLEQEQYDSSILIMKNEFWSDGDKIEGSLYFVPKPEFLKELTNQLSR